MGRKKHVFVWIIVTILLMSLEFIIYKLYMSEYLLDACPVCEVCEKKDVVNEVADVSLECDIELKEMDQALFTGIGMVFLSKNGDVYYEPKSYYESGISYDDSKLLEMAKKAYGEAQKYKIESEKIFNMELDKKNTYEIIGYKLELNNIKSMIYTSYGNSDSNYVFAFVSYNGKVSIIKLENDEWSLPKKLSEYNDIVSVVKSTTETGTGLIFIDKCGNKYFYAP